MDQIGTVWSRYFMLSEIFSSPYLQEQIQGVIGTCSSYGWAQIHTFTYLTPSKLPFRPLCFAKMDRKIFSLLAGLFFAVGIPTYLSGSSSPQPQHQNDFCPNAAGKVVFSTKSEWIKLFYLVGRIFGMTHCSCVSFSSLPGKAALKYFLHN